MSEKIKGHTATEIESLQKYLAENCFTPLFLKEKEGICEDNFFSNLQLLPNQFAYSINNAHGKISHAKGFDTFLGYPDNNISLEFMLNMFHPDDSKQVLELVRKAYIFATTQKYCKPFSVQLIASYRIRKADGSYVKILRQSTMLTVDEKHRMVSNFSLCTDISAIDKSDTIKFQMFGENADEFTALFDQSPNAEINLTPREKEILTLIAKGFATKEIAEKLKTSILTVETQRKNMLRKHNMKNTSQLIYCALEAGLI